MRVAPSPLARAFFAAAGCVFLALGIVGIFLPLLPTTPFVLLAAACFVRSSHRLHAWLLGTRWFGPMIREWEAHRSLPYRTKIYAIALMVATFTASIVFFVKPPWLKGVLALACVALALWMWRIPSRDRPRR